MTDEMVIRFYGGPLDGTTERMLSFPEKVIRDDAEYSLVRQVSALGEPSYWTYQYNEN